MCVSDVILIYVHIIFLQQLPPSLTNQFYSLKVIITRQIHSVDPALSHFHMACSKVLRATVSELCKASNKY